MIKACILKCFLLTTILASSRISETDRKTQPFLFKAERSSAYNEYDSEFLQTDFLGLLNTVPLRESNNVAIVDRGGSCYADSVIQMLFRIPIIRKIIANLDYYPANPVTQGLNHMFYQLQTNESTSAIYTFGSSMESLPGVHGKNFPGDADEYLNLIISSFTYSTPQSQHHHFILEFTYLFNDVERKQFDSDTRISLHIHEGPQNLKTLLDEYFASETVELLEGPLVRTKKLVNSPDFFAIHLQRVTFEMGEYEKKNNPVMIPDELDLTPYTTTSSSQNPKKYQLKMFIVHTGTTSNGHYISHYRQNSSTWLTFDDNSVATTESVQDDMKSGSIYFYEKIPDSIEPVTR